MKHWKLTHSGQAFDLVYPEPWMVRTEDMAISLSRQPRWTGHSSRVISVAQHSVHVARRAWDISGSREVAAQGLLHDGHEYISGDISTPIKDMFPGLREWERNVLMPVVFERYGVPLPLHDAVGQADREMLATEAAQFMPDNPRQFYRQEDVLDFAFPQWSAREARWAFLKEGQTLGIW